MEENTEYLKNLYQELSEVSSSNCPLKSFSFSLTNEEVAGEAIDCLQRFFDERSEINLSLNTYLTLMTSQRFASEEIKSCSLERFSKESNTIDYRAEDIMKKLHCTLKTVCSDTLQKAADEINKNNKFVSRCQTNCCSVKNKRRKMEDRHVVYEDLNALFGLKASIHQSFYAVFDGHGGTDAANYASSQLINNVVASPCLITNPSQAIKDAILQTDEEFIKKAKRERLRSGATAVTVLLQDNNLTVGWLGDSQVVLSKAGQAIQLMEPHKPDRLDERERIEALGGCVVCFGGWRVNGTLAVSRAIGDYEQKPYVSGEADIEEFVLEGDEEFLILACDGLWDTVEPDVAVETVLQCMNQNKRDTAAETLVQLAKLNRSMDNITVMIVYLDFNLKDQISKPNDATTEPEETLDLSGPDNNVTVNNNLTNSTEVENSIDKVDKITKTFEQANEVNTNHEFVNS